MKHLLLAAIVIVLSLATSPAKAQITIDTSSATDWKISNGVITVDWLPGDGRIFSMKPDERAVLPRRPGILG